MNGNHKLLERVQMLEKRLLISDAITLYQSQALGVLLALIEYHAETLGPLKMVDKGEIRRYYETTLRTETEKQLAWLSDHSPYLATAFRDVLKEKLDPPPPEPPPE